MNLLRPSALFAAIVFLFTASALRDRQPRKPLEQTPKKTRSSRPCSKNWTGA